MTHKSKWYVGVTAGKPYKMFSSSITPTHDTHGHIYDAVIGEFRTKAGASIMAKYGKGNPHLQHVSDAERMAKQSMAKKGKP